MHDVDEDAETLAAYGGHWNEYRTGAGITHRNMLDPSTTSGIHVASRLIYLS